VLGDKKFVTVENAHLKLLNGSANDVCRTAVVDYMRCAYNKARVGWLFVRAPLPNDAIGIGGCLTEQTRDLAGFQPMGLARRVDPAVGKRPGCTACFVLRLPYGAGFERRSSWPLPPSARNHRFRKHLPQLRKFPCQRRQSPLPRARSMERPHGYAGRATKLTEIAAAMTAPRHRGTRALSLNEIDRIAIAHGDTVELLHLGKLVLSQVYTRAAGTALTRSGSRATYGDSARKLAR
jgi:hypothetical protein